MNNQIDNNINTEERQNQSVLNNETTNTQRELGFEILRIIAMFLITCIHLINYGGFLGHANSNFETFSLRFVYSIFLISVNIFVLISAYFMVKSKFKLKKLINLWLTVVFYSLSLYILCMIVFGEAFSFKEVVCCFAPIIRNRYWFFTDYILIYLLSPFLNKILNNSSKKELYCLCIFICIMSYFSLRFQIDSIIGIGTGYNLIWFISLYMIGGTLRLYTPTFKRYIWVIIYVVSTLLILAGWYIPSDIFLYKYFKILPEYSNILVLIASISIFMMFRNIVCKNSKSNKIVRFISSTTFGIYLFQEAMFFKPKLYFSILKVDNFYSLKTSALYVLLFALSIYVLGFIYDCFRKFIFWICDKLILKIKQYKNRVEE